MSVVTAISMTVGRGAAARVIAQLADLQPDDNVADIGCGPGTAVRIASKRVASATGIDPDPLMLRLARRISRLRGVSHVSWELGSAEQIPLPDHRASVVWSLSSLHHWSDRESGLREIHRILKPAGRLLISERLTKPGAHGHAAHGITSEGLVLLTEDLRAAGFVNVRTQTKQAGHRTLGIALADVDSAVVEDN
jgi:ubiquinone/menaquinone biosynthesis C-methylase UbiE